MKGARDPPLYADKLLRKRRTLFRRILAISGRKTHTKKTRGVKTSGKRYRAGGGERGEMWRRERALALLTSELRLRELRIAGHPVELFSEEPKECKAATSPFSRRVWLKNGGEGGWSDVVRN